MDELTQLVDAVHSKLLAMRDGKYPKSYWTYREVDRMLVQASYRAHELR